MSTYMQRQTDLWQLRAWKAEDKLRCLLKELEQINKLVDIEDLKQIIEHYKGEIK